MKTTDNQDILGDSKHFDFDLNESRFHGKQNGGHMEIGNDYTSCYYILLAHYNLIYKMAGFLSFFFLLK